MCNFRLHNYCLLAIIYIEKACSRSFKEKFDPSKLELYVTFMKQKNLGRPVADGNFNVVVNIIVYWILVGK